MFDRAGLIAACEAHGRVVRVVVAQVQGSAPREAGAAMLVWDGGQSGTIGGGALEFELAAAARALTRDTRSRHALGPDLGQCCGGAVEILSEVFDVNRARALPHDLVARGPDPMPLSIKRMMKAARNQGTLPASQLKDGWMIEPVRPEDQDIWIWGAGHVGRALVDILRHVPGHRLTWADTGRERFPEDVPDDVTTVPAVDLPALATHAPKAAHHLILTYAHDIDLGLCHALLTRGFASCGLIGSATKWARFRKRLVELGHAQDEIDRITCPIGDPSLGKDPHLIAIGVAYRLAQSTQTIPLRLETRA
ncbi:xanthine dehydrogenase accessory protein XdhC [Tateyamaria omphalii]|uniref:xanthine dehydrogenase accessory protein XdhC n=1 Tax=Tateyamaria omphalii TaxID=299262 RepID=UPI001C99FF90|nr:xanthine dehydrogenase accessory protein XdhC [Tateyamaria omphalii]MBY5935219.1 xanthine dehydrogenase accessory protein XdhC [Tateyamaria omphalii]